VFVLAVLILTGLAAGCGSSGHSRKEATVPDITSRSDLLVTKEDIEAAGEGSPYAALLRWWRALQSGEVGAAKTAYANSFDPRDRLAELPGLTLRGEIRALAYTLDTSRPQLLDSVTKERTARLSVVIDSAAFSESDPTDVVFIWQEPVTFRLELEGAEWKLANDDYLVQALEAQKAATR
jgi:hypothetical protein